MQTKKEGIKIKIKKNFCLQFNLRKFDTNKITNYEPIIIYRRL